MSDPVITIAEGGTELVRTAEDAALLGSQVVDQSAAEAQLRDDRRRLMFHNSADAATTFAEGVIDALSMGLIRETGETADMRRGENAPYAMAGNIAGFAGGMALGGPVRAITRGAEGVGAAAAKGILRASEKSITARAVTEATASAALAGGQAFGHQLMDSILEDKDFSSEAILDEVKLAGVMGAVGGVALGGLSKLARKSDIAAQGGLVGNLDEALKPHREAIRAYDDVLTRHAGEVGVLRQMHTEGLITREALDTRVGALNRAAKARDRLDAINETSALSGKQDHLYKKWQKAGVEYRAAIGELDNAMQGKPAAPKNDLPELDALIERIPVMKDPDASFRFADTPPPAKPADFDALSRESPLRANEADELFAPDSIENPLNAPSALEMQVVMQRDAAQKMGLPNRTRLNSYDVTSGPRPVSGLHDMGAPAPVQSLPEVPPTNAGRPATPPRGERITREVAVDPEMVGERRAILHSNDLPDIYQPGGTGAGEPRAVTSAERPLAKGTPVEPPFKGTKYTTPDGEVIDIPPDAPGWEAKHAADQAAWDAQHPVTKVRPLDAAEARVQAAMAELSTKAGGRLDSAGALGILEQAGIRPAADNVGRYMDQVYALRKAGHLAADATKGKGSLKDSLFAAMTGGAVGGPLGAVVGVAANLMYLKRGGRIAASAGRLAQKVTASAEKLLSSTKVRSVAAAAANYPYAYSDKGPIEDPVERIQEIQFLAAHPDAIMERVAKAASDIADEPQLLQALQARTVNQMQRLAMRAPAIYFDRLGRPLSPSQGNLRNFFEYEQVVHNVGAALDAMAKGTLTRSQADALKDNWSSVQVKAAAAFMMDPAKLQKAPRETLRVVEMVTGIPLTGASDPMFIARQSEAWAPPTPPAPPSKPQAFNINPTGAPTPSQSSTGRAPGN